MVPRFRTAAALGILLALSGCKPPEEANVTAIIGAVLIDGNGGAPISDSVVVVAGSRIVAAGSRTNVTIPASSEKIDGRGKFLLPGLVDMHVHLGTSAKPAFSAAEYTKERIEQNLRAYLYYGITTVRSVGTERDAGFAVRKAQREGLLDGARLFTAGRGFTAPGGHPRIPGLGEILRQPATPEDARREVGELASQNADLIKIWVDDIGGSRPKIKREVIEAILEEARVHKIPVVAHIQSLADTEHLVQNGAAGILHMVRDTENIDPSFLSRLRDLKIVFTPTLVRQELAWLYTDHPERLDDPDVKRTIEDSVIEEVRKVAREAKPSPGGREDFAIAMRNTKRFAAAGVPIAVGSDGGSSIDFPGSMTHREIELLVEAGLSPMDVIVAATRNGGLGLGKLDEFGTVEPGKRADVLLVTANPLEDVRNLRRIERLMQNGVWVDRDALRMK
ncbi:MAG: amidohydrolase family protein [Bryobacteraceae bacterium]